MSQDSSLKFQDYLAAAGDAAKRTRTVIIVLVVGSVLTFVGLLNSLPDGWSVERLKKLSNAGIALTKRDAFEDPDKEIKDKDSLKYLEKKIGPRPPERFKYAACGPRFGDCEKETEEYAEYRKQCEQLYVAMVRTFVDNTFTIRVPFFGIAFDINYLGLLSGSGFVIILVLFLFTITRELANLKLAFEVARKRTQLWEFYHLLAMRQVLTIPPTENKQQSRLRIFFQWSSAFIPKVICLLPLFVYAAVTYNDYRTLETGQNINEFLTQSALYMDDFFVLFILLLTIACWKRWRRVDKAWKDHWRKAKEEKAFKDDSKT